MEDRDLYLGRLAWDLAKRCFTLDTLTTLANIDHLDEEQAERAQKLPADAATKWGKRRTAEWKKQVDKLSVFQIIDSFGKHGTALRRNLGKEYSRAFITEADVISLLYVYAVVSGVDFDDLIEAWMPVHLALQRLLGMIGKEGKKHPLQFAYFVQQSPQGMTPAALFLQKFIRGEWGKGGKDTVATRYLAGEDIAAAGYLAGLDAYEELEQSVGGDKVKVAALLLEGKENLFREVSNAISRGEYRTDTDKAMFVSLEKPLKKKPSKGDEKKPVTLGDTFVDETPPPEGEWGDMLDRLTREEGEIVTRLFLGHTKIEIAQALDMSRPTLDARLEEIQAKLTPLAKEWKIIN